MIEFETGHETVVFRIITQKNKYLKLKVVSRGKGYGFYYAIDNEQWSILIGNVDACHLSTTNSFGFTGTTIGMYATKKPFENKNELGK